MRLIQASSGWFPPRLADLWEYRELVYFLAWRDIKVRYKQTVLGIAWAILQPLSITLVFTVFLGRLVNVPSDGLPYPVFVYAALVPWMFLANGLTQSADSLVGNANLITKVYFPRLAIPASAVLSNVIDVAVGLAVLPLMMVFYGLPPSLNALWVPVLLAFAILTAFAAGMWFSALNVEYRDVRYALPFVIQFWMFATPIAYPSSLLGERWRTVYWLNPMAGVVEGFRWALLGAPTPPSRLLLVSALTALVMLAGGALYFRRMERTVADVV